MPMDPLTPQQERFAQLCTELVNHSAAYRKAYDCAPDVKWTTVATNASRLAALPHVAARIRELQDQAAAKSAIPSLAARIQELRALESANPNDIISLVHRACRHCFGFEYGYQWRDETEYANAVDLAIKQKSPHPSMDGGFGYDGSKEPAPECPVCYGDGLRDFKIADTTKLTGGARLLYKGVKIKGNGDIEILLHDQMQARDMLNRIMGAYKDSSAALTPVATTADAVEAAKTPEERQRAYLRLVAS